MSTMMTVDQIDASLSVILRKEQEAYNDSNDDINLEDVENLLSMYIPSLSTSNSVAFNGPDNGFLRLTAMVRTVYLSYLRRSLFSNYATCYKHNDGNIPCIKVKRCADQMELNAVRLSLEASLYRQNMLKLIADVNSHTAKKETYGKLAIFLETPKKSVDVAVQTDEFVSLDSHKLINAQNICITSNCKEILQTASPTVNSTSLCENDNILNIFGNELYVKMLDDAQTIEEKFNIRPDTVDQCDSEAINDVITLKNDDENSQDSLLQHMKDMFCESDDSSDLTRLIEKHSSGTKINVGIEINKIHSQMDTITDSNFFEVSKSDNVSRLSNIAVNRPNTTRREISYSRYKEIKNRGINKSRSINGYESIENKQKQKNNAFWLMECVYEVSKLKEKLTELSQRNNRKYYRVKKKFLYLFGETGDEEDMINSPIHIEEHLLACKERIAPWIVEYLMPFYNEKRIKNRQLFKLVGKHIVDMLIFENPLPEQDHVRKYIKNYFKNRQFIKTKYDIYA